MWVVVMGQYLGSCQQTDWLQLKILGVISLWATAHKNGQFSDYTVRSHVYCGMEHTKNGNLTNCTVCSHGWAVPTFRSDKTLPLLWIRSWGRADCSFSAIFSFLSSKNWLPPKYAPGISNKITKLFLLQQCPNVMRCANFFSALIFMC
jgi:hypothetical protein